MNPLTLTVRPEPFDWIRTGLSKGEHVQLAPFMVRQAHHERNVRELMGHWQDAEQVRQRYSLKP